jgi:hypothetical protein
VDGARFGDGVGVEHQRLGQGGLTGVGMADHGEGTAAGGFGGDFVCRPGQVIDGHISVNDIGRTLGSIIAAEPADY